MFRGCWKFLHCESQGSPWPSQVASNCFHCEPQFPWPPTSYKQRCAIVSPKEFLGPHELEATLLQIFNVEGCCVCGGGCGLGGDQVRRAGPFAGPSHRAFGLLRPEWQAAPDRVATVPQRGQETETEKRGGGGKVGLGLLRTLFCQQGIGAPKPGWPWQFFAWYALSLHLSVPVFEVQCVSRPLPFFHSNTWCVASCNTVMLHMELAAC